LVADHRVSKSDAQARDPMNGKQLIKNLSLARSHPVNSQTTQRFSHTESNGIGKWKENHEIKSLKH